ncbi:MAG: iron-sulfur cluster assembly scaffold protein [Candidatus Bipolaricaulota bacterium]|nr:iron-sulfur cluster assembly scaffold protein [Candidatus Bipolaricaulota bacterium]MDW8126635.1 iron-sulfur cluster assembly scaffold protein [Candidatus Bipolaricaulota bacterium]
MCGRLYADPGHLRSLENLRNKGRLPKTNLKGVEFNPVCGDAVRLELEVYTGRGKDVRFDGQAISQAAVSVITELIQGQSLTELKGLKEKELLSAQSGVISTPLNYALLPFQGLAPCPKH